MNLILLPFFAVAVLLIMVSIAVPVADRLRLPHTVLLAALGIAIGLAVSALPAEGPVIAGDVVQGLGLLGLEANVFLALFLPPLLFSAGLGLDVRRLIDEFAAVLLLAVVAVVVCTVVVGLALAAVADVGLMACLLLGSIIATTDPAAVVAIFRELGAPRRLSVLVEGESVFNDAAAIAIFGILMGFLTGSGSPSIGGAAVAFSVSFLGGIAIGYALARMACELMPRLQGSLLAETTVTVALAYLVYVVCEGYFGVSGVVGVATAALTMAAYGPLRLMPRNWRSLLQAWDQVAFWSNSLIFMLASILAARLITQGTLTDLGMLAVLVAAAFVARALVIYGLLPGLAAVRLTAPVDHRYRAVIMWGGLRGAITIVLALAVTENQALPAEVRHFVSTLAVGFVLFTLFVSAPTLRGLLRLLGLDRLAPTELALRNRVLALSRASIRERIDAVAKEYGLDPAMVDQSARMAPPGGDGFEKGLDADVRLRVGLLTVVARAKELYLEHFDEHTISRQLVPKLVAAADEAIDRVKTEGVEGFRKAVGASSGFGRNMRAALWLHRRCGLSGPLSRALADRFEILLIRQLIVRELIEFNRRAVRPVLGEVTSATLDTLLGELLDALQQGRAALELQYPDYARDLATQHLLRAAIRLEDIDYRQKLADSLISREVFNDLQDDLKARRETLAQRPSFDLGLELAGMVGRVPMFAGLDRPRMEQVARLLNPMLATPGERIVTKGERGDAMYFIAAGEVEVVLENDKVGLRAGDFFGELALLHNLPRTADVVAVGYCHLLALEVADWRRLLRANPDLKAEIERIAEQRLPQAPVAQAAQ